MNFLQLAQKVALESGTVPGDGQPVTVASQTGRLASVVRWTNDAWLNIQNHRQDWRFMRGEFSATLLQAEPRYTPASLGISDFADWTVRDDFGNSLTLYDPDSDRSDEGRLTYLDWETFYQTQLVGAGSTARPRMYAVSPANELVFSPTPDKDYAIRGLYRKAPQTLVANTDTPTMPARFHGLIVYRALVSLGTYDESMAQLPVWMAEMTRRMADLERDQLPKATLSGASWLDS